MKVCFLFVSFLPLPCQTRTGGEKGEMLDYHKDTGQEAI